MGKTYLQGIWDFRSITPLQRPEALDNREFLTEAEAAKLEREVVERNRDLDERPAETTTVGGDVGAYNNFWMDRDMTTVGTRRTSLIVDPANGRIPPFTPEAEKRAAERNAYRRAHPADSWADRSLADRCLFTTGLPILPSVYNTRPDIPDARSCGRPRGDDPHGAYLPSGPASARERPPVDGDFARPLGG